MALPFSPSQSPIAETIRTRRTINDFEPIAPPLETILQAIELARWAPNHKMTEPWRFHLLGPKTITQIVDLNTRLTADSKGAEAARKKQERWSQVPGWLMVTQLMTNDDFRNQENYAAVCCAIQNLTLFLWSEKIGVKWTTGDVLRRPEMNQLLNLNPEQEQIVGMLWYGFPALIAKSTRKEVETITQIHS